MGAEQCGFGRGLGEALIEVSLDPILSADTESGRAGGTSLGPDSHVKRDGCEVARRSGLASGDPVASRCRIQSNYLALQRINQELEDKLYRMVRPQHTLS